MPSSPASSTPERGGPPRPRGSAGRRARRLLLDAYGRALLRGPVWDGRTTPRPGGRWRPGAGEAVRLMVLGDSSAVSVGVGRAEETVGGILADALADELSCPVTLDVLARAGATTASMAPQVRAAVRRGGPGVALVLIGGNDVCLPLRLGRSAAVLGGYAEQLRAAGWHVVVGACADVAAAPGLRGWIRPVVGRRCRRLAREQPAAALVAGAAVVSLTVPEFRSRPGELFCPDGFHPSADGYALYLARVAVAVRAAGLACRAGAETDAGAAHGEPLTADAARAAAYVISEPGACLFPVGRPLRDVVLRRFTGPAPVAAGPAPLPAPATASGLVPGRRRGEERPTATGAR
ncbi:SGNH/GDSL hydrolase family protein [Streptomyces sp. HMX112]|uniref:SGNH/GDSL hydrolase family protein n=1 Tax=Streptomyces sp. HMX112 TaxID=3390850 RepID=UPI003A8058EE